MADSREDLVENEWCLIWNIYEHLWNISHGSWWLMMVVIVDKMVDEYLWIVSMVDIIWIVILSKFINHIHAIFHIISMESMVNIHIDGWWYVNHNMVDHTEYLWSMMVNDGFWWLMMVNDDSGPDEYPLLWSPINIIPWLSHENVWKCTMNIINVHGIFPTKNHFGLPPWPWKPIINHILTIIHHILTIISHH